MSIERIKYQMRKTFYSDAWHGGSVMEFLSEINAKEVASRPLKARHSIWELVPHMENWKRAKDEDPARWLHRMRFAFRIAEATLATYNELA